MKKIIRIILHVIKTLGLLIMNFRDIYKYGGYATADISMINYGEILKGRNVLITGGSSGIGLCIAKKCIQQGASVIITGRNEVKLKQAINEVNNPLLKSMAWDVSNVSQSFENILKTKKLLGGDIDILVNNAGVLSAEDFPNVTEEVWDKIYATNSKGVFFLTQSLCSQWMKEDKNKLKKVINISSQGGFVGATYPYRMTKWDVAGLTQGLGIRLAPYGIIVNGIAPGITATSMLPECLNQKRNIYCSQNPLKRFAFPEEIAELALFLMSNAGNFIVGQSIVCDGGYSLK